MHNRIIPNKKQNEIYSAMCLVMYSVKKSYYGIVTSPGILLANVGLVVDQVLFEEKRDVLVRLV